VALVGASALIVFGGDVTGWTSWVGFGVTIAIAAWCAVLLLTRTPSRLLFQLIILAALVNVALLALSGDSLLA
jgi:hypothetical protein